MASSSPRFVRQPFSAETKFSHPLFPMFSPPLPSTTSVSPQRLTKPGFFSSVGSVAVLAFAFSITGCNSPKSDPMIEALSAGERPVAMKGADNYFDGKVSATVTISRGFGRGLTAHERKSRGKYHNELPDMSEIYDIDNGGTEEEQQKQVYENIVRIAHAQRAAGSPMPPVTLRLILENHGQSPLEIEVREVNSDLGNFAARPSKLNLAAGQTGELDPMISQLGVTSDEIPVQVALRSGGKTETKTVLVKNLFTAIKTK
jgi:hypothetical protein